MKQTRKIRKIKNKKLFLKWLKKSHRNKYNIVHSGGEGDEEPTGSEEISKGSTNVNKLTALSKSNAILLAGAVTLGEVAYSLASNPIVINAVLTLSATSMVVFASVMSGGSLAVLALVGLCVCLKVKALYSKYLIMMHVVNDYMLLLQKIDTMARIAVKLSQQYKFVIDTRDVTNSLQRIFSKFNKILSEKDIKDIHEKVIDKADKASNFKTEPETQFSLTQNEDEVDAGSSDEVGEIELSKEVKERQNKLFERFKRIKNYFSLVKKGYKLSSKKFSQELNDEVTRLGLYFSILLGELNIMLNVCQMDVIGKQENGKLLDLNTSVKSDNNFKNLLISSIIYRTLQLYNIFELCKDSASSNATKKTCSDKSIEEYVREIDTERTKISIVLFGKSNLKNEALFPLYAPNLEKAEPNSELEGLRTIMRKYRETIDKKEEAQKFLDDIKKFNEDLKKQNGKLGSSSITSTSNITNDSYELDYGEVGKAAEQPVGKSDSNFLKMRPFSIENMKVNPAAVAGNPVAAN
jgi:flagellin-like hook-associated protein FlgL